VFGKFADTMATLEDNVSNHDDDSCATEDLDGCLGARICLDKDWWIDEVKLQKAYMGNINHLGGQKYTGKRP
jgi:hypothetical protein